MRRVDWVGAPGEVQLGAIRQQGHRDLAATIILRDEGPSPGQCSHAHTLGFRLVGHWLPNGSRQQRVHKKAPWTGAHMSDPDCNQDGA